MEFALANLLYCFDWELPEGVQVEDVSMEEAGGLTVHKKTPLLLVPTRYKCASHTVCSRQCLATAS
jgi:4-hydroxyphenylacetaldehyde oxime monooxygenase